MIVPMVSEGTFSKNSKSIVMMCLDSFLTSTFCIDSSTFSPISLSYLLTRASMYSSDRSGFLIRFSITHAGLRSVLAMDSTLYVLSASNSQNS